MYVNVTDEDTGELLDLGGRNTMTVEAPTDAPTTGPYPLDSGLGLDAPPFPGEAFTAADVPAFQASVLDHLETINDVVPLAPAALALGLVGGGVYAADQWAEARQHRRTKWPMYRRIKWGLWPGPGFAGWRTLNRDYGRGRPRMIAKRKVRPSLTWRDRWFGDPAAYSVPHGVAHRSWCGLVRHTVRTSLQDLTIAIAPAQEGKSVAAVSYIWNAPGPVVATTIRADLLEASGGYRSTLGELHIWNPAEVGTIGSTFRWNIVDGCEDYKTAIRRANAIVGASSTRGLSDGQFWSDQAAMTLASFLHAAALVMDKPDGRTIGEEGEPEYVGEPVTIQTVRDWMDSQDVEPYAILHQHPGASRNAALNLLGLYQAPQNTRGSILTTLRRALRFCADEAILEALTPKPGEHFDIGMFLRSRDTLYLMAPPDDENSPVAPLMAAFVGELYHEAMRSGSRALLDPPLTMVLDEVANICPIPLPAWASYSGGSGIQVHAFVQSWAQVLERWGPHGAETIWNNAKFKLMWPQNDDDATKERLVAMGGTIRLDKKERIKNPDGTSSTRTHEREVAALMAPGSQIPDGYVLAQLRGKRPTVIKPPLHWKDKRSKIPLPTLPPVQERYVPGAMPELRGRIRDEAPPLPTPERSERPRAGGRSPEDAPSLGTGERKTPGDERPAGEERPRRRPSRSFNPTLDDEDIDL